MNLLLQPINSQSNEPNNTAKNFLHNRAHTVADLVETELLKILNHANAPHYLFRKIMEWASNAKECGYNF